MELATELFEIFRLQVKHRLEVRGWTQSDLADILGVGKSYVSQILNGHRNPGFETLDAFSKALSCSPEDLISKKSNKMTV